MKKGTDDNTELPTPTEKEIKEAMEAFREDYLRHEHDCLEAAKAIESLMGAGRSFNIHQLKRKSNGRFNEHTISVLRKIGLCGKEADKLRIVFSRDLRLKWLENSQNKLQEMIGELRFHEEALLAHETGKRAAPRKVPTPAERKNIN